MRNVDLNNINNIVVPISKRLGPRELLIEGNVRFGTLSPSVLNGRTQLRILLDAEFDPLDPNADGVFFADTIMLDFEEFQMRQLFYFQQLAKFVPIAQSGPTIPQAYVGKTNQQLWDEFGIAFGGQIAPSKFMFPDGIHGIVAV